MELYVKESRGVYMRTGSYIKQASCVKWGHQVKAESGGELRLPCAIRCWVWGSFIGSAVGSELNRAAELPGSRRPTKVYSRWILTISH